MKHYIENNTKALVNMKCLYITNTDYYIKIKRIFNNNPHMQYNISNLSMKCWKKWNGKMVVRRMIRIR